MSEELQKQIENHLINFPERQKEMEELKKAWEAFTNKFLWVLIGGITIMVSMGVFIGSLEMTISQLKDENAKLEAIHTQLETRVGSLEISRADTSAQLTAITASLGEIKASIVTLTNLVRNQ